MTVANLLDQLFKLKISVALQIPVGNLKANYSGLAMKMSFVVGLLLALVSVNSMARDASVKLAECESEAYKLIGVQIDSTASLSYLETKYELVRVCLVRQGFRFKGENWSDFAMSVSRRVHTDRGTNTMPGNSPEARASQNEVTRLLTIARMTSRWWE